MVEQTIEQRRDGGGVAEELVPVFHGAIRLCYVEFASLLNQSILKSFGLWFSSTSAKGKHTSTRWEPGSQIPQKRDQRGRVFVAAHDDLEEILGRGVRQLPHGEIIDEEERDGGELRQVLLPRARQLGISEFIEQHVGFAVERALALLDHGEADRLRQVAFARAGRTLKQSVFVLGDEAAGGELEHEAAVHLLVEVKVEGVGRLAGVAEAGLLDASTSRWPRSAMTKRRTLAYWAGKP